MFVVNLFMNLDPRPQPSLAERIDHCRPG